MLILGWRLNRAKRGKRCPMCDAYRDGKARGELRRAVALSTVCRM